MLSAMSRPPAQMADVPAAQLDYDYAAPFPILLQARSAAGQHDYAGIARAYAGAESWSIRTALVRVVGETLGLESFLGRQREQDPSDMLAALLLASHHIELGWAARTGYRAEHVRRDQFAVFHQHLRIAEQLLIEITAREPANLAAWTCRLMTTRGLELGQSEARRRYDEAAKHDPNHLAAQTQLLQQLCPKWGGTLEEMHAFAYERAFSSPPGSLNAVLIPDSHLEHGTTLSGKIAADYLRSPAVRDEVIRAATHSVLHPNFRPVNGWVTAHSYFALYFSLADDPSAAAVHFRAMGPYAVVEPWSYVLADPREQFLQHRARALKKG